MARVILNRNPELTSPGAVAFVTYTALAATASFKAVGTFATVTHSAKDAAGFNAAGQMAATTFTAIGGVGVQSFDPASLPAQLWVRGSYDGSPPWDGVASAGSSGNDGYSLVTSGNDPDSGTAVDGFTPAHFIGSNGDSLGNSQTVSTVASVDSWHIVCLVRIQSIDSTAGNGSGDEAIISDTSGAWGLSLYTSGGVYNATAFQYDGGWKASVISAISLDTWYMFDCCFTGSYVKAAKNNESLPSGSASSNIAISSGTIRVGKNSASQCIDADIMELMVCNRELTTNERTGMYNYFKARYPAMSLP